MDFFGFLESLGFNTTRLRWRVYRWQNAREARREEAVARSRAAPLRALPCDACGALVDASVRRCPYCSARLGSPGARLLKRRLALVLPSWHPVGSVLLAANGLGLLAGLAAFGPAFLRHPSREALFRLGALIPHAVDLGQWWRVLTYGYLHIGLVHFGFNMMALTQVAPFLEREVGSRRILTVYTLALLGAAGADLLLRAGSMTVIAGASGGLFGLIGFGTSYAHFYGGPLGRAQRDFFLRWAAYGFVFGLATGADNIAHGGGFVSGALLGWAVERERRLGNRLNPLWTLAAVLCALATLAAFAAMIRANVS
jgi:membrane associated rhomboid family serine protease